MDNQEYCYHCKRLVAVFGSPFLDDDLCMSTDYFCLSCERFIRTDTTREPEDDGFDQLFEEASQLDA